MLKDKKNTFFDFTWLCTNGISFQALTNVSPAHKKELHQGNTLYQQNKYYKIAEKEQY